MKAHIPNMLTLLNLACGSIAILYVQEQNVQIVAYLALSCLVLDFLDGFAARILNAHSAIGAQLDSLADVVSFGVLPSFMMFNLIQTLDRSYPYFAFIIVVFAAYRLAKFNISDDHSETFSGLPVPAMMIAILGLYISIAPNGHFDQPSLVFMLLLITALLSILMISSVRLLSLKSLANGKLDLFQILLITSFIISIIIFGALGLTIGIGMYIILSLIQFELVKK